MKNLNAIMIKDKNIASDVKEIWKKVKNRSAISTMLYQFLKRENYKYWIEKSINDYNENGNKVVINKMYKGENKIVLSRNLISVIFSFLLNKNDKFAKKIKYFNFKPESVNIKNKENEELLSFLSDIYDLNQDLILNVFNLVINYYIEIYQKSMRFRMVNLKSLQKASSEFEKNIKYHLLENNKGKNEGDKFKRSFGQLIYLINSNKETINLLSKSYIEKVYKDMDVITADFNGRSSIDPSIYHSSIFYGHSISNGKEEINRKILMIHLISLYRTSSLDLNRYMNKSKFIHRYIYIGGLKCMDKTFIMSLFIHFLNKK